MSTSVYSSDLGGRGTQLDDDGAVVVEIENVVSNRHDNDASSSDEETSDAFRFLRPGATFSVVDDDEEQDGNTSSEGMRLNAASITTGSFVERVEIAFISRKTAILENMSANLTPEENLGVERDILDIALCMMQGRHCDFPLMKMSSSSNSLQMTVCGFSEASNLDFSEGFPDTIRSHISQFVSAGDVYSQNREKRALLCMLIGCLYLELYMQANYTGPELIGKSLIALGFVSENITQHKNALNLLFCDGECAFPLCVVPQCLVLARSILSTVSSPLRQLWGHGIELSEAGVTLSKSVAIDRISATSKQASSVLKTRNWLSARACVTHLRAMQRQSYDALPTMWLEYKDYSDNIVAEFGAVGSYPYWNHELFSAADCKCLSGQAWVERGLAFHHFNTVDKVNQCSTTKLLYFYNLLDPNIDIFIFVLFAINII